MSQKWFIAFLGVMDYFNFSFSAFKSSRLSPCSPAVLSTQRFKESMAKEFRERFKFCVNRKTDIRYVISYRGQNLFFRVLSLFVL